MPSRRACAVILVFWLGFNGYLLYHDLLPRLMPGQPPPFTIDLVEEARERQAHIDWNVLYDGKPAFRARTGVEKVKDQHDVFSLTSDFTPSMDKAVKPPPIHGILVHRMFSRYRVNAAGDLLGLEVTIAGRPQLADLFRLVGADFDVRIHGEVTGGKLTPHLVGKMLGQEREMDLPTVNVPAGVSVLLPLHPVNRIRGLRPGQSWTMRVFDPLEDSVGALRGLGGDLRYLRARVIDADRPLPHGRPSNVACYQILYDGDRIGGTTWVGKDRGQVLAQEVKLDNQLWVMYRD